MKTLYFIDYISSIPNKLSKIQPYEPFMQYLNMHYTVIASSYYYHANNTCYFDHNYIDIDTETFNYQCHSDPIYNRSIFPLNMEIISQRTVKLESRGIIEYAIARPNQYEKNV